MEPEPELWRSERPTPTGMAVGMGDVELSWRGRADALRMVTLVAAALMGLAAGRSFRVVRRWSVWRQRSAWLAAQRPVGAGSRDERSSRIGTEVSCG